MLEILEELSVFSPLGIRFWDPLLEAQIRDALHVTARPATGRGLVVKAFRTASDVYAFRKLPGLLEYGLEDATTSHRFIIKVEDSRRRFLTAAFAVDLPLPYRGVFLSGAVSSPSVAPPNGFYLYSAPTRPIPSWLTAVRGELIDRDTGKPAAHAVIHITVGQKSWDGLADEAGRFVVLLPYPTPTNRKKPLFEQTWDIRAEIRYEPDRLEKLPDTTTPDYLSILTQAPAQLSIRQPENNAVASDKWLGKLQFCQELMLRTEGKSSLVISPGSSSS